MRPRAGATAGAGEDLGRAIGQALDDLPPPRRGLAQAGATLPRQRLLLNQPQLRAASISRSMSGSNWSSAHAGTVGRRSALGAVPVALRPQPLGERVAGGHELLGREREQRGDVAGLG